MFCFACGKQLPDDAAFCLGCGTAMPSGTTDKRQRPAPGPGKEAKAQKPSRGWIVGLVVLVVAVVLVVLLVAVAAGVIPTKSKEDALGYAPSITLTPASDRIVSGAFTVPATRHLDFRFDVDPAAMRDAHVIGHFLCTGGRGNDIMVVLAEEKEFGKWIDGQVAQVYYTTGGKVTTGSLDVQIRRPGTYYLSFSNTFSALSAKTVSAEINLKYSKATIQ